MDTNRDPPQRKKIEAALRELELALAKISEDMKPEYLEALEKCPELVETESMPLKFLMREDFDARAAALRLVVYWRLRKEAFEEKAFLPLAFGPEGAMDETDFDLVKCGYLVLLPQTRDGYSVYLADFSRQSQLTRPPTSQNRMRFAFFLLNLILHDEKSASDGYFIINILDNRSSSYIQGRSRRLLDVVSKAMPLRVKKLYIAHVADEMDSNNFLVKLLPVGISFAGPLFGDLVIPMFGDSTEDVLSKFLGEGLKQDGLPPKLGGTWTYDQWEKRFENLVLGNSEKASIGNHNLAAATHCDDIDFLNQKIAASTEVAVKQKYIADEASVSTGYTGVSQFRPISDRKSPPSTHYNIDETLRPVELLEEVLDVMPLHEKSDYAEASQRVPFLVETESPPARFFSCTDLNASKAARLLVSYWDVRRQLFGERTFLPLTLSGKNALTHEDLSALNQGYTTILPSDSSGRPVVCLDHSRLQNPNQLTEKSRIRMLFYAMQVVSENENARTEGIVVLIVLPHQSQRYQAPFGLDVIFQTMPVKLHMVYLLGHARGLAMKCDMETAIPSTVESLNGFASGRVATHVSEYKQDLCNRLEMFGLRLSGIPESLGGNWRYDIDLPKWKDQQSRREVERTFENLSKHACGIYGEDSDDEVEIDEDDDKEVLEQQNELLPSSISIGQAMVNETTAMISKGLADLEEAIALLPDEDKAALLEARERIPDIVTKEAPPVRFLRFESYNTWAAAKRLATYWTMRKETFGERYLLPMNQSGEGTLTRDDVTSFGAGYYVPISYDSKGRTVLCYDPSRMSDYSREVRLRIIFYLFQVVSENEQTQREGCKVVIILRSVLRDPIVLECVNLVLNTLPVRFQKLCLVNCPSEGEKTTFTESLVPLMLKLLGLLNRRTIVVVADTKKEMGEKLVEQHEMSTDDFPECVGGTWSYEQFPRWQELRTRYEWDLPPVGVRDQRMPHIPEYKVKPRSQLSEDEKIERKRRLNVLNSRRKRERVRVEVAVFNDQVVELRKRNRTLNEENERLESLLEAARGKIAKMKEALSFDQSKSQDGALERANLLTFSARYAGFQGLPRVAQNLPHGVNSHSGTLHSGDTSVCPGAKAPLSSSELQLQTHITSEGIGHQLAGHGQLNVPLSHEILLRQRLATPYGLLQDQDGGMMRGLGVHLYPLPPQNPGSFPGNLLGLPWLTGTSQSSPQRNTANRKSHETNF